MGEQFRKVYPGEEQGGGVLAAPAVSDGAGAVRTPNAAVLQRHVNTVGTGARAQAVPFDDARLNAQPQERAALRVRAALIDLFLPEPRAHVVLGESWGHVFTIVEPSRILVDVRHHWT